MDAQFTITHYKELSKERLYALLSLRSEVFVVEQRCHYQDLDFYDEQAHHVELLLDNDLIGCARILPPGLKRDMPSIGRYGLKQSARGKGLGQPLFKYCIEECRALYPDQAIYIQAQYGLEAFYQSFGFVTRSEPYLEAGIDHVDMVLESAA